MSAPERKPKPFHFSYQRKPNGLPGTWRAEQQGNLLAVANAGAHFQPPPGIRQPITEYTNASRLYLLKKLARIDWRKIGISQFITLTYPDACWDGAYPDRTDQRTRLFRWIEDETGRKRSILWKTEWQPRKRGRRKGEIAPHLHIVVFRCAFISWKRTADEWGRLIGADYVHVHGDTTKGNGAARYCAKYASKTDGVGDLVYASKLDGRKPGRPWGWTRQELMPLAPMTEVDTLSDAQVARAMQVAGSILGKEKQEGFLLFSETAELNIRFIIDGTQIPLTDKAGRKYDKRT